MAGTENPTQAPQRVLVIDDNEDVAETLAELLGLMGHEVKVASDGAEAIALAQRERPDVIFLDIGLPDMDGYQVAQQLRKALADWPLLVAMTGYGREEDRRRTREAGFDEHVVKPATWEALEALLRRAASRPRPT